GKIVLVVAFILAGLAWGDMSLLAARQEPRGDVGRTPMFAIQLVYVSFSYSGWNTAAYMAGEFRRPARDIPRAVLAGTALATVLYVGLNVVFLAAVPLAKMAGEEKVAHIAATSLFGERGGNLVAFTIMA